MIQYGEYSKSTVQKIFIISTEIIILWISYMILFRGWGENVIDWLNIPLTEGNHLRKSLLFAMEILVFLAYLSTILVFIKRKISWTEALNLPFAYAIYYIGFALLGYNSQQVVNWIDLLGVILVIFGLSLHFVAELELHLFKKDPHNKGKLLTTGLWSLSRHVNYFADLLWVTGFALITRNWWSTLVIIFLFVFFYFFNIPIQEKYLSEKYKQQFLQYKQKTKSLIPFIL